jgi:hypothetical protein
MLLSIAHDLVVRTCVKIIEGLNTLKKETADPPLRSPDFLWNLMALSDFMRLPEHPDAQPEGRPLGRSGHLGQMTCPGRLNQSV